MWWCRFGRADHEDRTTSRNSGPDASARTVRVEDHRGSGQPELAGRVLRPDRTQPDRGRESVDVVGQLGVIEQGQDNG